MAIARFGQKLTRSTCDVSKSLQSLHIFNIFFIYVVVGALVMRAIHRFMLMAHRFMLMAQTYMKFIEISTRIEFTRFEESVSQAQVNEITLFHNTLHHSELAIHACS